MTPEDVAKISNLPKSTELLVSGDNWPERVTVDVTHAGLGTIIDNQSSARVNVAGTTEAQREAIFKTDGIPLERLLTIRGDVVVGNEPHQPMIALDEIPHGAQTTAPIGLPPVLSTKAQKR